MEADLGQVPAPHAWLKDLGENERITGLYLVREKSLGTTRKGEPFLSLILADRTGEIEAKVWDQAEQLSALVILPLVLLIIGQSMGLILIDRQVMIIMGLVVLVGDVILLYLAIRLFQRETILTRWK